MRGLVWFSPSSDHCKDRPSHREHPKSELTLRHHPLHLKGGPCLVNPIIVNVCTLVVDTRLYKHRGTDHGFLGKHICYLTFEFKVRITIS